MTSILRPLVSVIIPVYNGENYLREAIDSVLTQTYPFYEIIVVDDGSRDNTKSIAESYGSQVIYVYQTNGGAASAFNHGLRLAQGDYVAWLSHDDVFLPEKLERQVCLLEAQPQVGACLSYYYQINAEGKIIREMRSAWYQQDEILRQLMRNIFLNFGTIMFRRSCIEKVGFLDEKMGYAQDAQMLIRIKRHFELSLISEFLLKSRVHPAAGSKVHANEVRRNAEQMYRGLLSDLSLDELFPDLVKKPWNGKDIAEARYWLGDAMCFDRRHYNLALSQYWLSIKAWPTLGNPIIKRLPVLLFLSSRHWIGSQLRNLKNFRRI